MYNVKEVLENWFVVDAVEPLSAETLAQTLDISVDDAVKFLNSGGKTYVFAKKADGSMIQLYHPHLAVNDLVIHFSVSSQEELEKFQAEWRADKDSNWFEC